MLESVLSNFKRTELWDDIPPAMSLVETVIAVEINQMMAETGESDGHQQIKNTLF